MPMEKTLEMEASRVDTGVDGKARVDTHIIDGATDQVDLGDGDLGVLDAPIDGEAQMDTTTAGAIVIAGGANSRTEDVAAEVRSPHVEESGSGGRCYHWDGRHWCWGQEPTCRRLWVCGSRCYHRSQGPTRCGPGDSRSFDEAHDWCHRHCMATPCGCLPRLAQEAGDRAYSGKFFHSDVLPFLIGVSR